jgi:hypothetical protein
MMKRVQKWAIVAGLFMTIGFSASYASAQTECTRDNLRPSQASF